MPRLVVFDLDGTLVDSRAAIVAAMDEALARHGDPAAPDGACAALIGLPLSVMFPRLAGRALDEAEILARAATYRACYPALAARHERLIDGVDEVLRALSASGRRLAVATSKGTRGAKAAVARHGLADHFAEVLGFDAVPRPKPAPDMVEACMASAGVGPHETVMVGDTTFDIEMGRRAGVRTVAVAWGVHPRAQLEAAGAHAVVEAAADLLQAISPGITG